MKQVLHAMAVIWLFGLGGCAMDLAKHDNPYELQQQGLVAYGAGEDGKAEKLFKGLLAASPNNAETWFYLGNLYARSDRPDEAVQAYQKALMLNSGDPRVWHNIGIVRLRQAWAAIIQANALSAPDDVLHARTGALLDMMEKFPVEGMKRTQPPAALQEKH